ncbi:MAG: biopolymer transporter ExbD [Kofleriaceae bacterium]
MGMNVGGSSGGLHTEINITPLIDVVLVLLIIFLVTMPIMMKMVTLEVPRKLDQDKEIPDPAAGNPLIVRVLADLTIEFDDGGRKTNMKIGELAPALKPVLDRKLGEKVVFVDFEDQVPWLEVVSTMDVIRSLSADQNHEEVKVALKVKETPAPQ